MKNREIKLPKNKSFFLFGPRQTGKSTLLKALFNPKNTLTFDLLKSEDYLKYSAHPSLFREEVLHRSSSITHVIVDEIQRIPDLLNEVHLLLESSKPPFFILTGSSARKLKRSQANLLAGRALSFHLHPFTVQELGDQFHLQKILERGALPAIYLEEEENLAQEELRAYVDTYLKEEIEREAQVRQVGQFIRFLQLAGHENGNILNYSNLARETGTTYQTVKSYFQILEDTLIGKMLFPYSKSERKRLAKHPKFYFFDVGVVRALQKKLSLKLEPKTYEYGRSFEHFVILEIFKKADYLRKDFEFSFYRTEAGAEVDLIIETPQKKVFAIEIKSSQSVHSSELGGLYSFKEICPKAQLFCVGLSEKQRFQDEIKIVNWRDFLEELFG